MIETPAAVLALQGAGVDQRSHELLEKERVPFGLLEQPLFQIRRECLRTHESPQQLTFRIIRERLELELARTMGELRARAVRVVPTTDDRGPGVA